MKKFEIREIAENEEFDPSILNENVPFTQAGFYGDWQKSSGRLVKRYLISSENKISAYFQVIKYPLIFGKNYLYIPYGPVLNSSHGEFGELLKFFKQELKNITKKENAVFTRLDFTPKISNEIQKKLFTKASLATYHSAYFQPRVEWFLNLEKPEEILLQEVHEKNRYSIRLAERKGVTTEIITKDFEKYFDIFYELMEDTAKRNGFSLHDEKYYKNVFKNLHKTNSYLVLAKFEEKVLAIDLIIVFGKVANYVFSGSSTENRNFSASSLGLWKAIIQAKSLGCKEFNFGGISAGEAYAGWEGLTRFKKRFGGREEVHSDFFDVVASYFWYYLYCFRKLIKKMRV